MDSKLSIQISVLGGFRITLGDEEVSETAFKSRKALTLVKLLAIKPGFRLHRDQAMDALWPGLDPLQAAAQLYKSIHYARKALEATGCEIPSDTLLVYRNEVLTLTAPGGVRTDLEAFQQLAREARRTNLLASCQRAVASYTGDLLPADVYESWAEELRESLRLQFLQLLMELSQKYIDGGYLADAADAFRRVLAIDPLNEAAHQGLMRAFTLQGSRSQALHQYQRCVEILAKELDAKPSAETVELYEQIRSGKIQPVRAQSTRTGRFTPKPALGVPKLKRLVGRRQELNLVSDLLNALGQGKGNVLILEGVAGIGKMRLAQEILRLAQRKGYQAMMGSAHEEEKELPYSPLVEALEMAVSTSREFVDLIPAELAAAIPGLEPGPSPIVSGDPLAAQSYLFAGILRYLQAMSEKAPVVLILDDLHIADDGTLKLFHYLARRVSELPLLLVGTYRSWEPDLPSTLTMLLSSLSRAHIAQHLVLQPLSEIEHKELLLEVLGKGEIEAKLAQEVFSSTEGSPLFASEMVDQLVKAREITFQDGVWRAGTINEPYLPPSLRLLLAQKWNRLSSRAQSLLNVAAVAGHYAQLNLLEQVLNVSGEHFLDLLDESVSVGLLKESGLTYLFVHPLFREAIYQQMSQARRRELHGRMARALEALFPDDPSRPIEAIAHHYVQSGEVKLATHYLIQAGNRAEALYAHDDALQRYREALELLNGHEEPEFLNLKVEVHERMGDVYKAIGDIEHSLPSYKAALEILNQARLEAKEQRLANLHRKIALAAILSVDMQTAEAHLREAWNFSGIDPLEEARVSIIQALFHWHCNELEKAVEVASRALEIAEKQGAEVEASQACEMLALAYLPLGKWEEGLKYEQRRKLAGWSPDIVIATDGHLCLWEYHLSGDEPYEQATHFINQVSQQASKVGDLRCVAVCHYALGSIAFFRGIFEEAEYNLEQARALQQRIKAPAGEAYTLARQAQLLTFEKELLRGWQSIQEGIEVAQTAAVRDHCLQRLYAAGLWNRVQAHDMESARRLMQDIRALEEKSHLCPFCGLPLLLSATLFYLHAADLNNAWVYAQRARQFVEITHNVSAEAQLLKLQGQIYTAENEVEKAEDCFAKASDLFRALGQKPDLAETLLSWSELLKSNDLITQARRKVLLREANSLLTH